jgi:Tfp pilus assembly protein PilZ
MMASQNVHNKVNDEKRKHSRMACDKTTFFASRDKLYEGFVKNISLGGVFVQSEDAFFPGEILTLAVPCESNEEGNKLKEPFKDEDVKMKCKVIWNNPGGFGMAFMEPK